MFFVCSLYVQRITYRYALIRTADLSECVRFVLDRRALRVRG